MNKSIDLNADMGEGLSNDAALMPLISSANIACGFHAGDADTMKKTVELAINNQVAIGAHPGFNDRHNFGRLEQAISLSYLFDLITEQIYLLQKTAAYFGTKLHHVKPHGALYNMAAREPALARCIAAAIRSVNPEFILYGLSGSHLLVEAAQIKLPTASETFADRTYQSDGSLTPRNQPGAMIENSEDSMHQVLQMVREQQVKTLQGIIIPIKAETICIHGDGQQAIAFATTIRKTLTENQITIQTI